MATTKITPNSILTAHDPNPLAGAYPDWMIKAMDSYASHLSERVKELEDYIKERLDAEDRFDKAEQQWYNRHQQDQARIKELEEENLRLGRMAQESNRLLSKEAELEARIKELESQQQPVKEGWISIKERGLPKDEDNKKLYCFSGWYPNWERWINRETMTWNEFKSHRKFEIENSYTHYIELATSPPNQNVKE